MKIAIDLSQIIYETGVSYYSKNLVSSLLTLDKKNKYLLFGGSLRRYDQLETKLSNLCTGSKNNSFHRTFHYPPLLADFIWNKLHIIPIETLIGDTDVFHSSDWSQPPSGAFKITTIHDLVPILYPNLSHPRLVSVHRKRIEVVRREVDRIIVPTLTTSNDLIKLGFDPGKIRIIPEAPDRIYQHQRRDKIMEVRRKYRIYGNYLLAVGATPRKNVERIIRAFEKVGGEIKVKLVIIGQKYGNIAENRGTIFLGHIPEKDMPSLYSGAEALVYPSLYEGFGLPILEAFASGIPVVTSNFGSMKEVASDAARLVDPYNISSVKDGIIDVIKNRKVYIDKGKARIKDFSWRKTAISTLETYKEAYQ